MNKELNLKVFIKADGRYKFDRKAIRKAVTNLLVEKGLSGDVVLSIFIVGERKIKELSKKYLDKDEVTDVLSFSQIEASHLGSVNTSHSRDVIEEDELMLGDVVVCYGVAKTQAVKMNKLLD